MEITTRQRITWTSEEDDVIVDAFTEWLKTHKSLRGFFESLSTLFPHRTLTSLYNRADYLRKHGGRLHNIEPKCKWTAREDTLAISVIESFTDQGTRVRRPGSLRALKAALPSRSLPSITHRLKRLCGPAFANVKAYQDHPSIPEWSAVDTGYIAGIFDGEGSLYIAPINRARPDLGKRIFLVIVTNTDKNILDRVKSLFPEGLLAQYDYRRVNKGHKPCAQLLVRRNAYVMEVCRRILPYVAHGEKRRRIIEVMEYLKGRV